MNATHQAVSAYGRESRPFKSTRGVELDVFTEITRAIDVAAGLGPLGYPQLVRALHSNRQLWTVLAADVSSADNELTSATLAQIFYLAEFVRLQTSKVLKGEGAISALTDINISIMRGLKAEPPAI